MLLDDATAMIEKMATATKTTVMAIVALFFTVHPLC
jgi:hypothetical protein